MGEKLGPSPEQSNLKFENLRLFGVPFGAESVDEEFGEKEQNAKVAFEVDGIPFALHVRKVEKMENGRVSDIQFHFRITQEAQSGNLVTAYVEFEPNKFPGGQGAIAASIKREKGSLPKGFGMAFYGKMIDFMQDQVNAYQKPFKGVVTHATDMGTSPEVWDKKFGELLKPRGYEEIEQGRWEKNYLPEVEESFEQAA